MFWRSIAIAASAVLIIACGNPSGVQREAAATPENSAFEVVGWYSDPKAGDVVIFREGSVESVIWIENSSENPPKPIPFAVEDFTRGEHGSLSFTIVRTSGRPGREITRLRFNGSISEERLIGEFESFWAFGPLKFNGIRNTQIDIGRIAEFRREAEAKRQIVGRMETCISKRAVIPEGGVEVVGNWRYYRSNGEHEWGYEIMILRFGGETTGVFEDFRGLVGDGGPEELIRNVRIEKKLIRFEVAYEDRFGVLTGRDLRFRGKGEMRSMLLKAEPIKTTDAWMRYQYLVNPCFAEDV